MNTTIAAISTPFGKGGVALIRISGPQAIAVADRFFSPRNRKSLAMQPHARMTRGDIRDGTSVIDDGMAAVFFAPHSYTGEDVVEITCHGGILLTRKVLQCALCSGAEAAGPGEFTQRAFLNGKLRLSQAEAVIDLIDAESEEKIRLANSQSRGVLAARIQELYQKTMQIISSIYAYVDFPDEDMTDFSTEELQSAISDLYGETERLMQTYHTGRAVTQGIQTVICGKPNTGKSSLLNCILGENRAIVTDVEGTTRDTIEETAIVGKIMLRLCDTAGIRSTTDKVEELGIERSVQKLKEAELILAVFDPSRPFDSSDRMMIETLRGNPDAVRIALLNKTDLPALWTPDQVGLRDVFDEIVPVCCRSGAGIDALRDMLEQRFIDGSLNYDTTAVLTNARQYAAVEGAHRAMGDALDALRSGMTQDVAGLDLELALSRLGELDGRTVTQEVVNDIFHRFCVGK